MKPAEYAAVVVIPTVREFMNARGDRRLAYLACIAAYHLVDYICVAESLRDRGAVLDRVDGICRSSLEIIRGLCNGTKHPKEQRAFAPGTERFHPPFAFDVPGAGWGTGRFDVPGLSFPSDAEPLFVDGCLQTFLLTLRRLYPMHFAGVDFDWVDARFQDAECRLDTPQTGTADA